MFNEKNCLENLKHIVSEFAVDEHLKNMSLEELRSTYTQLADNLYHISVSNSHKYKNMLWNMDNLKPEIQSKFLPQIFDIWYSIYKTSIQTGQIENLRESKRHDLPPLSATKEGPEFDPQKQRTGLIERERIEGEKQSDDVYGGDAHLRHEEEPSKGQSHTKASPSPARQYENDWFDKLLDFFAAIVGCVSKIASH
jgi:hypothetical protein